MSFSVYSVEANAKQQFYSDSAAPGHFCTHISDSCTARARIPAPSVRAEDSLRPLVDYKYNSVWDGVGIMSYRYEISECSNVIIPLTIKVCML